MSDHYIVKVNSGHGAQYSHIVLSVIYEEGQTPGGLILEVDVGPFPTAEEAWVAWHKKQGNLKA